MWSSRLFCYFIERGVRYIFLLLDARRFHEGKSVVTRV